MNIKKLPIVKEDENGIIYDCDKAKLIIKKKDSVSADHSHKEQEILFLLEGTAEISIGDEKNIIEAPVKVEIPSDIYHKILALSDIKLLHFRD